MRSGRRRAAPPPEEGAPAWMNTYGDMVTLLLTFFVLLFAFSSIDAAKWKTIVQSFTGKKITSPADSSPDPNFGFDDVRFPENTPGPTSDGSSKETEFDELYEKIKTHIKENGEDSSLNVTKDGGLITIRVTDTALFNSGEDQIRSEALTLLDSIITIFDEYDDALQLVHIEGHTDNVPISGSKFRSNWDLSTSRAVSMVQYCIEHSKLSPMKYAASGYGEYHPISNNDSEEGRAKNRRVDFLLLSTKSMELVGGQ
jgi:chemotaxis protein MotB